MTQETVCLCFGILESENDNLSVPEIPVVIELSKEHIAAIAEVSDFVKAASFVTKVAIDLRLSLPTPGVKILSGNATFAKEFEQYKNIYALVFRDIVGFGVTYEYGQQVEWEDRYFASVDTDTFIREAREKLVVLGDQFEERLCADVELSGSIVNFFGRAVLDDLIRVAGLLHEDIASVA